MRHLLAVMVLAVAVPVLAQDGDRQGRIRYLEPGVTLQRASDPTADEADTNMPFLPGDRVWTDGGGRVEFQFDDGGLLRLDSRSKLDFQESDGRRADGSLQLRLWSGGLYLHARRDAAGFQVETPGGVVEALDHGVYRIDVESGETRLSVYEGEATLDSGRQRVRVQAGERAYARAGESPERPRRFDRRDDDDFARWDNDREGKQAYAGDSRRYLPDEVEPYGAELEAHGSWYYESEVGHVWRPYVAADWRPYNDGRWVWTAYGWTWVPYESWGWAPFHYGRWGFSPALGWYWIPGSVWSPAWVTWAVGGDYVGWCPLGYRDRPVVIYEGRGNAVQRGSATGMGGSVTLSNTATATVAEAAASNAWVMVRRGDMSVRDLAKRRVDVKPAQVKEVRMLESPQVRPARDLTRVVDVHAAPRDGRTKPTIGDVVPELRNDPKLGPAPRPRPREDDGGSIRRDREPWMSGPRDGSPRSDQPQHPTDARKERERRPEESHPQDVRTQERNRDRGVTPNEGRHPTDTRSPESERRDPPARERENDRQKPNDPDHEVVRRFFQPVTEPRTQERSHDRDVESETGRVRPQTQRSEPRQAPPPQRAEPQRSEPRKAEPRPAPKTPPPSPPKEKDKHN